jgi:putative transcriptional regulator
MARPQSQEIIVSKSGPLMEQQGKSSSLAPALLLSMPQLDDPNFSRTVVLLCEHTQNGAFGLVLNRPTGRRAADLIEMDPPVARDNGLEIWFGGPVEPQRGWILTADQPPESGWVGICDGLYLSTSSNLLRTLLEGPGSSRCRLLVGYAGWGPGQLDAELSHSSWLVTPVDTGLVFGTDAEAMWSAALRTLGVDPISLQISSGVQ